MGYFENLAESAFKTGANGETYFYRWGIFGKPYIVPSISQKEETKKFLTNYFQIGMPLAVVGGIIFKWLTITLIPILLLYYEIGIRKRIRGWSRGREKLTVSEAYSNSSKLIHPAFLWFGVIFSALFVLAGLLLLWKSGVTWIMSLSTIFFVVCFVSYVKMIAARKKTGAGMRQAKIELRD